MVGQVLLRGVRAAGALTGSATLAAPRNAKTATPCPVELGTRIPILDGIRGLAILLVMIYHMTIMEARGPFDGVFIKLTSVGWIGVDLFFVLSGFLITGILFDAKGATSYFGNFYAR